MCLLIITHLHLLIRVKVNMKFMRKIVVKNAFTEYLPQSTDYEIIEEIIPPIQNNEILVKAEYISVDPYMRSFAEDLNVPYVQFGFQVGTVVKSKNSEFPVGTHVVSHAGWQDYSILTGQCDEMFGIKPYKPEIGNLPLSLSIGALGMPGITAYLGFLEICKPRQGDIVCVSSAAGAVGSLVGQIARLKGCTVIGLTGGDHKVHLLKKELGFHYAINYKTVVNIKESLQAIAPNGINVFFDNVGGFLGASVMECVGENGRIALCGAISTYGSEVCRRKKPNTRVSVNVESFSFTQWDWSRQCAAMEQLKVWIEDGSVKAKETVSKGFEVLPDTLIVMLKGENVGKTVVKV